MMVMKNDSIKDANKSKSPSPLPVPLTQIPNTHNNKDGKNTISLNSLKKFEGLHLEPMKNVDLINSDEDGTDAKPITKEEEWVTKKKTELTTTRQIETRVKRQVVLEDGKVIDDSGPMVSTNTTEDTDKKESETTERVDFGSPDLNKFKEQIEFNNKLPASNTNEAKSEIVNKPQRKKWSKVEPGSVIVKTDETDDDGLVLTPRQEDGLVREIDNKRIISREEIDERLETEDVQHLGDFSDETFVKAVNSGAANLEEVLYSEENQKQLVPLGPKIVHQSTKSHKVIDTEGVNQKSSVKPDGKIVTEKKKTTEHEEFVDKDEPDNENLPANGAVNEIESSQRFFKQRDEQNVEYVADGKVIAKEMRYAAETEQMERDGPHEGPHDWDSLSDRIRKTRRHQKTILQHQREAALLADRKDALTKRPLNFDREEETRKGETMKWLESHFGSESTASSDSREGDHDSDQIEPSKKTFFNVTIKSNHAPSPPIQNGYEKKYQPMVTQTNGKHSNGIYSFSHKHPIAEKNAVITNGKTKYYQGISNWSDRKESSPKHFASKAFKDELQGLVERNNLRHVSREDLRYLKALKSDDNLKRESFLEHKKQMYGSRNDLKYHRKSSRENSDDSKNIRLPREDIIYYNDTKKDSKYRRNSNDDRSVNNLIKTNSRLKREDSGYVKDSREDLRSSILRDVEDETVGSYRQSMVQRDDSAYVSSSNFTENRTAKIPQLRTPDSGIRSPSPEPYDPPVTANYQTQRPAVPLRKRAIEKKLKQQVKPQYTSGQYRNYENRLNHNEPPPDYSPPPRSRSITPPIHVHPEVTHQLRSGPDSIDSQIISNGIGGVPSQRSRYTPDSSIYNPKQLSLNSHSDASTLRPTVSTQTSPPPKQPTKVGQAIGNSFKKLVGKIRSASAERKLKMKTKSKSRERSPSPLNRKPLPNDSTYQQYNVIDSHIGESLNDENVIGSGYGNVGPISKAHIQKTSHAQLQQRNSINRESSFASLASTATTGRKDSRTPVSNSGLINGDRIMSNSFDKNGPDSYDIDMVTSPKQRYYLGEDPYGNSLFGKENKYNKKNHEARRESITIQNGIARKGSAGIGVDERDTYSQRHITSSTLGRYQKSNQRHLGSTPNLDTDFRTAQTLPRKLEHREPSHHSSTINVSIVNQLKPTQNTGPAKPARTYKTLNRSKSFNVHGMNGTNDPSPIYLEKLTKNNYSNIYKSNPHLNETGPQLKSPSIVNLISRSQKDLSRLHLIEDPERQKYPNYLSNKQLGNKSNGDYIDGNKSMKKDIFFKDLHEHAPELSMMLQNDEDSIQTIHSNSSNRLYKYSDGRNQYISPLESKSSVEIMKDTASILRRGSSSTEDYTESYNFASKNNKLNMKNSKTGNIMHSYSKTNVPKFIDSNDREPITSSRYRNDPPSNLNKYKKDDYRRMSSSGGTTIIEVKGGKLRK